jgi:hypothetical protein
MGGVGGHHSRKKTRAYEIGKYMMWLVLSRRRWIPRLEFNQY